MIYLTSGTMGGHRERVMPAKCSLRYEQPVGVPQVMHPTCRFQDVSLDLHQLRSLTARPEA